jgi:hypothetical protein
MNNSYPGFEEAQATCHSPDSGQQSVPIELQRVPSRFCNASFVAWATPYVPPHSKLASLALVPSLPPTS